MHGITGGASTAASEPHLDFWEHALWRFVKHVTEGRCKNYIASQQGFDVKKFKLIKVFENISFWQKAILKILELNGSIDWIFIRMLFNVKSTQAIGVFYKIRDKGNMKQIV